MTPEELMIGDWVYAIPSPFAEDKTKRTIKIESILVGANNVRANRSFWRFQSLEPIPITAEILENNGFYKVREHKLGNSVMPDTWVYKIKDVSVVIALKEGQFADFEIHNDRRYATFTDSLCVSELQHAMRLIGLHDMANDFKIQKGNDQ